MRFGVDMSTDHGLHWYTCRDTILCLNLTRMKSSWKTSHADEKNEYHETI